MTPSNGPRVAVIGIDCGTPQLLFDDLAADIPNINALMQRGMHGDLASITPPITIPAWACAMSGKTPGQLAIYGMRNRKDTTYDGLSIASNLMVKEPQVWDELGKRGMRSLLIGVPPGFPVKPINGWRVPCFLTPPSLPADRITYPADLWSEITEELGDREYIFDISNFRERGKQFVLDQVFQMTERRFQVARRLVRTKPWDYFMMVEMGSDRLHHVFWDDYDPLHPKFVEGNPFQTAFHDYYRFLDKQVGMLVEALPEDCVKIVMSDHGARRMVGGVQFNEWLVKEGYLAFSEPVTGATPIAKAPIDWSRTVAWGDGGYYGRCFLNVKGREPQGIVENYEETRDEIAAKLEAMTGPDGEPLGNRVLKPQDVYTEVNGVAPDLIVYFGDLEWRSVGQVGTGEIYTYENDTGPDGANHDRTGVFVMADLPGQRTGRQEGLKLIDAGASILSLYGIEPPEGAVGRSFL